METRAELETKLAEATARLEALPRLDQVRQPHAVMARRTALAVKIASLQERLSTAPVHNGLPPVDGVAAIGDKSDALAPVESEPGMSPTIRTQGDAQADSGGDLHE